MARRVDSQPAHRQRVGGARMIGRDQNSMPRRDGCSQSLDMPDFVGNDAFGFSQIVVVNAEVAKNPGPEIAPIRRNELIGLLDDDSLHTRAPPLRRVSLGVRLVPTPGGFYD